MSYVIHAGQIIDGTGAPPLSGQDVGIVVIGETISYVGELGGSQAPEDAADIWHTGTVLPGLIDMHAHVSFEMTSPRTPYAEIANPVERIAVRATSFLRRKLACGITTMRAMSERSYVALELRDAVAADLIAGPDLLAAGLGVRAAHGWGHTGTPCTGPWEVRGLIRANAARGCDLTKLFLTNNGASVAGGQIPSYLTDDEIRAAVDESLRAGLPAAAHCMGGPALAIFIEAGGSTVEHGFYLSDEDLRRMHDHDATLVCTMGYLFDRQDISAEPEALAAREVVGVNYARAISSGVSFVLGSDDGSEGVGHEIVCLSRYGVPALSAITAATSNAARVLGLRDRGTIAPGLRADLAAVAGDPLCDVEVIEQVSWVMRRGRLCSPTGSSACITIGDAGRTGNNPTRVARPAVRVGHWQPRVGIRPDCPDARIGSPGADGGVMRGQSYRRFGFLAAASAVLVLAACSSQSNGPNASPSHSAAPAPLTVAVAAPVTTLDPAQACDDTSYMVVQQLYDELVQPEVTGNTTNPSVMKPMLAQSWRITDGGRVYTFVIRKGVRFVNGDPLTSADVVFSLKRDLSANGCGGYILSGGLTGNIRTIVALGRYAVQVTLARPDPVFLLDLGRQVGIIDESLLAAHGGLSRAGSTWLASHDAGSGPYKLAAFEPDSQIVLQARPDYWAGRPKNSQVTLRVVTDPSSLELLVSNGGVNLALGAPLADLAKLAKSPGVTVSAMPSLSYINVGFNISKAPLNKQLVREALTYATPVQQLVQAFGAGYARSWAGPLLPGQLFYRPIADPYPYDLAKARALLHQAGVTHVSLTLIMSVGEPTEQNIATVLQASWAKVGVQLHISTLGPSAFMNELNGFSDQLYMITDRANPDPGFYFGYFLTCGNPFNWSRYCNATVTRLLNRARFSTNVPARATDYQQVQGIAAQQAPYLQLFHLDQVFVTHGRLSGLVFYYDVTPRFAAVASEPG